MKVVMQNLNISYLSVEVQGVTYPEGVCQGNRQWSGPGGFKVRAETQLEEEREERLAG